MYGDVPFTTPVTSTEPLDAPQVEFVVLVVTDIATGFARVAEAEAVQDLLSVTVTV